jgi:glycerate 2-kinase
VSARDRVRARLERALYAALAAVDPGRAIRRWLCAGPDGLAIGGRPVPGRLVVLAVGKAAAAMARAAEEVAGERIAAGLAVTVEGYGLELERVALREAGHPVPDARCPRAAAEALRLVGDAAPGDVLLVLLSGGASSLLTAPIDALSLGDLARTTEALLGGGAAIDELNAVRKHLTAASGGRLARAAAARRIEVLVVSDVSGDRLDVIGSGPFAPDPTRYGDALAVVDRLGLRGRIAPRALAHLEAGARGEREETPGSRDPTFARVQHTLVATNRMALDAAAARLRSEGVATLVLPDALRGEARVAGRRLAALARAVREPVCLVAGGETVVTLRGTGRGGRNQELALAAALEGLEHAAILAAGTDGIDGPTDAAGAFADGQTPERGRARGLDARAALAANDSYGFFSAEGGVLRTGPTRTNVMDLALIHRVAR